MAIGESMSSLFQEGGAEGSPVGEMMNSVMAEEQVMAVLGSLRPVLNIFCPKLRQIVFFAMSDCRKIYPNTSHMGCAASSSISDSGDGCSHFCAGLTTKTRRGSRDVTTIADCISHANEPKMTSDFRSQSKGSLGAVEHERGYLVVLVWPSRQR